MSHDVSQLTALFIEARAEASPTTMSSESGLRSTSESLSAPGPGDTTAVPPPRSRRRSSVPAPAPRGAPGGQQTTSARRRVLVRAPSRDAFRLRLFLCRGAGDTPPPPPPPRGGEEVSARQTAPTTTTKPIVFFL